MIASDLSKQQQMLSLSTPTPSWIWHCINIPHSAVSCIYLVFGVQQHLIVLAEG